MDKSKADQYAQTVPPMMASGQALQNLGQDVETVKDRITRLDTALAGEQAAYKELQGRLPILTSLVASVGNTVGSLIHFFRVPYMGEDETPMDELAATLADMAQGLAGDLTTSLTQMGVDPAVLLEATGVTMDDGTDTTPFAAEWPIGTRVRNSCTLDCGTLAAWCTTGIVRAVYFDPSDPKNGDILVAWDGTDREFRCHCSEVEKLPDQADADGGAA